MTWITLCTPHTRILWLVGWQPDSFVSIMQTQFQPHDDISTEINTFSLPTLTLLTRSHPYRAIVFAPVSIACSFCSQCHWTLNGSHKPSTAHATVTPANPQALIRIRFGWQRSGASSKTAQNVFVLLLANEIGETDWLPAPIPPFAATASLKPSSSSRCADMSMGGRKRKNGVSVLIAEKWGL